MREAKYTVSALFIMAGLGLLALGLYARPSPNNSASTIKVTAAGGAPFTTTTPDVTASPDTSTTPNVTASPDTTTTPVSTGTPECGLAWRTVNSPNPGDETNRLSGIDALSPNDIWAVGGWYSSTNNVSLPLVERWDGQSWTVMPGPSGLDHNGLYSVSALSDNDVWVAGSSSHLGRSHTLISHWDGTQWTSHSGLDTDRDNFAQSVAAISSNDAWVVGSHSDLSCCFPLLAHWDGTQLTAVPGPLHGGLRGVAALSSNDVWAVGRGDAPTQTLTLHWDGQVWNTVPSPRDEGMDTSYLMAVSKVSSNDVWAVGASGSNSAYTSHSLTMHWDGTQWSIVSSPDIGGLNAVSAVSANDVWAVGEGIYGNGSNSMLHWNGIEWRVVTDPNSLNPILYGVVEVSPQDVWAVGLYNHQTLVTRYNDPCSPNLVGHVTWQGPPPQPRVQQQLPLTLTLKSNAVEVNYPAQNTNSNGYFEISLSGLSPGSYQWRAKGPKYLASSGTLTLDTLASGRASPLSVDMGMLVAGDANNDNQIGILDFNIMKVTFGRGVGEPAYDERAEFTGDSIVNAVDFNRLRNNFGLSGAPPI